MVIVTYAGRASRVHIGDGIVLARGVPTEVHPLIGLPLRGRRDFDVLEIQAEPKRPKGRTKRAPLPDIETWGERTADNTAPTPEPEPQDDSEPTEAPPNPSDEPKES